MLSSNSNVLAVMLCLTTALWSHGSFARTKPSQKPVEVPTKEDPGFSVEPGLSESLYQNSIKSSSDTEEQKNSYDIDASLRIFFPSKFVLENKYFKVPYDKKTYNIAGFIVGPSTALHHGSDVRLSGFMHIGYAYAQDIYEIESESGLTVKDTLELQWIPLQAGLEFAPTSTQNQKISWSLFASLGTDWYTQSGNLDGTNQTFWTPRAEAGVSSTFFARSSQEKQAGFSGIRASVFSYQTFATSQVNKGLGFDLGTKYAF